MLKKILFITLSALVLGLTNKALDNPRPRFELILSEDAPAPELAHFAVYHDKETRQEVVCYEHKTSYGGHAPACWLTGRRW